MSANRRLLFFPMCYTQREIKKYFGFSLHGLGSHKIGYGEYMNENLKSEEEIKQKSKPISFVTKHYM